MDTNIGKFGYLQTGLSNNYMQYSPKDTLNNQLNGEIMKGKKQTLYALKIQMTSYDVDSESCVKTKEQFFEKLTSNPTEALLSFMIQKGIQERASFVDGYMNTISDFMCRQLSELRKELSNMSLLDIGDKELSLLIFQGAADGLMNFMRGSKQSRTDWFTTPDIVQRCETSGE